MSYDMSDLINNITIPDGIKNETQPEDESSKSVHSL